MEEHPETAWRELLDCHDELCADEADVQAQERERFMASRVVP